MAAQYRYQEPAARQAWRIGLVLLVVLCSGALHPASNAETRGMAREDSANRCESMAQAHVPSDVTLTAADLVPQRGGVPEHCLVVGFVTTGGDQQVTPNRVGFHVGLPTDWNGDFHFQGVGGFAGVLGDISAGLSRGYASASTDTGHVGSGASGSPTRDGSWALGNRAAQIDWGYRGTHVATVASKEVTRVYYRESAEHSFFVGCSNGGRQGLMEAQRYPEDYDGIVAHSPAVSTVDMFLAWIWQVQAQLTGPRAWLSPEDLAIVSRYSLETAANAGEVLNGLVVNPEGIQLDLADVKASGELSPPKIRTLRRIYGGWHHRGDVLVQGHPIGHEEGWATFLTGTTPPRDGGPGVSAAFSLTNEFLRYFVLNDPQASVANFSVRRHLAQIEGFRDTLDATNTDLSEFADHGGKLLMTHGWSDPALNPMTTIRYHHDVEAALGARARDTVKLYMVPGMFHCAGGPGLTTFDALSAMERWVREGIAPGPITATGDGGRSGPLCPHPSRPRSTSSGDQLWQCGV